MRTISALIFLIFWFSFNSCTSQTENPEETTISTIQLDSVDLDPVWKYYFEHVQDSIDGKSLGSVSNGSLENGSLIPFSGENYSYFDTSSYLSGRAFSHQAVIRSILDSYNAFIKKGEPYIFRVMECSNEHGGRIFPHRTHQNGLSVDFMTPLLKNGERFDGMDNMGISHYSLEFDKEGNYLEDPSISIDFDMIAQHILMLNEAAKNHGLKINKVIFNTDLKDELFASPNGKKLMDSGIYITKNLTPLINSLHDDHYHIDFQFR